VVILSQWVSIRIVLKLRTWKTIFSFIHCNIRIFYSIPMRCINR
jgi:hypothetical protein